MLNSQEELLSVMNKCKNACLIRLSGADQREYITFCFSCSMYSYACTRPG